MTETDHPQSLLQSAQGIQEKVLSTYIHEYPNFSDNPEEKKLLSSVINSLAYMYLLVIMHPDLKSPPDKNAYPRLVGGKAGGESPRWWVEVSSENFFQFTDGGLIRGSYSDKTHEMEFEDGLRRFLLLKSRTLKHISHKSRPKS